MNSKNLTIAVALLIAPTVAVAADADVPRVKCVMESCSPAADCKDAVNVGNFNFNVDVGHEYLFIIDDPWEIKPGAYRLDNFRHVGDSYLVRTTVDIAIDRASKAMKVHILFSGTGVKNRDITASGTCEDVRTVPAIF